MCPNAVTYGTGSAMGTSHTVSKTYPTVNTLSTM